MSDEHDKQKTGMATLEKIRPELNLEKWSVWQPASSQASLKTKALKREITLPDGSKLIAEVKIAPSTMGAITTEDQKTFYVLIKCWEDNGRTSTYTYFSLRGLAKLLKKGWGTNTSERLNQSLDRLYGASFFWKNSYYDSTTGKTLESVERFRILDTLKTVKTKTDGVVNKEEGYFRFNDFILKNLQANHTKPLLLDVVLNFSSEVAQILYVHLDLILADKTAYERRTKELFDDLGLDGKEYKYPSARKRILERAIKELNGVPLTTGAIASITIEETQDKKDYKIVVHKTKQSSAKRTKSSVNADPVKNNDTLESRGVGNPEPAAPILTTTPASSIEQQHADELLQHFNQVFFKTSESKYTRTKHRDLATSLVAQHGLELTKYIVDFAHAEAQKTKFNIATFGGITQYIDRAVEDYDRHRKEKELEAKRQAEYEEQQKLRDLEHTYDQYRTAELRHYAKTTMTREQYEALIEAKRQELRAAFPLVAKWSDEALTETARSKAHNDLFAQIPLMTFEEFCTQHPNQVVVDPTQHQELLFFPQPVATATIPEQNNTVSDPIREA